MYEFKNILFTFDYELFLGKRSGTIDKCVIEPTQKILDLFSLNGFSWAIFFVDTTWLLRMREVALVNSNVKKDYEKVEKQLNYILKSGHYIFPHLHPHWVNAIYLPNINQWQLTDYAKYRFHKLDKGERELLFDSSIQILKDILGSEYKPIGYRAGGWSIQPFEDFEPLFRKHGILYDFSVLPGNKCISTGQHYDFSDVNFTSPYRFSKDVIVSGKGDFVEFPISTIEMSSIGSVVNKVLLKYLAWTGDLSRGNGNGIVTETLEQSGNKKEMVSIELLNSVKLPMYLKFLENNSYMQFISHPKMLTPHNISVFERFVKIVFQTYDVNTDFFKMVPVN